MPKTKSTPSKRSAKAGSKGGTKAKPKSTKDGGARPSGGGGARSRLVAPISAGELTAVLQKGPLSLVQLGQRLNAVAGARRRQFRELLKQMIKDDLVQHDGGGIYGLVTRQVRKARDSAPSDTAGAQSTSVKPAAGPAVIAIGMLNLEARYACVEVVSGEHKGRINLSEKAPKDYRHGDTVSIAILAEDKFGPRGVIVSRVSRGGGAAQAAETLLATNEVPRVWPDAMDAMVAKLPTKVAPASFKDRVDLRELPLVTIDGETAKDFDDAVYAERAGRGWRLVVAIADVAHYVNRGGVLDQEAELRGTSVYLADRVIPMLPEALSNGLCSLRPNEIRLAMVCDMRVSAQGRVSKYEFYEAAIRSWARLTYTQVGAFLDDSVEPELTAENGGTLGSEVKASVSTLKAVFDVLRQEREARGALDFEGREATVEVVDDRPIAIHPVRRNDAHKLIEEAMIAANVCAARLLEGADVLGMYRVHEPPPAEKVEMLRQALAGVGVRLPDGTPSPKMVQEALTALQTQENAWLLESQVLRALSQACYTPENKGHFGLALKRYMHFTSPIRRYADLVVHRAIKAAIKIPQEQREAGVPVSKLPRGAVLYEMDTLLELGAHLSQAERRADETSWGVDAWLKCEYMAQFIGQDLNGMVVGVTEFGLFVELEGAYVQGLVHISELGRDYFQFQPLTMSLVGDRSGLRYSLGDELRVTLKDVNPPRGRLELVLTENASAATGRKQSNDRSAGSRSAGERAAGQGEGAGNPRPKGKSRGRRRR